MVIRTNFCNQYKIFHKYTSINNNNLDISGEWLCSNNIENEDQIGIGIFINKKTRINPNRFISFKNIYTNKLKYQKFKYNIKVVPFDEIVFAYLVKPRYKPKRLYINNFNVTQDKIIDITTDKYVSFSHV